jgi:nucleotide-binding universal stress UspA family protein
VPLDFSGKSRQALEYAVPLAQEHGGKISLVHVLQPAPASITVPGVGPYAAADDKSLITQARKRLVNVAAEMIPGELQAEMIVRRGNPYNEIIAAARALKADLIVISTHGYTGLKHALIGSVAERVVRHASCPVLAVRRS